MSFPFQFFTLLLCCGFAACGSEEAEHEHEHQSESEHEHEHQSESEQGHENEHEHENADAVSLALNDGARWVMDDHSRQSFEQLKHTATAARFVVVADAATTAGELKTQLQGLISGCTMQGPAHDNLHVFLGMFIPAVDKLETSADVDEANENLNGLRRLLDDHGRFFE